jgi:hypothetical protein
MRSQVRTFARRVSRKSRKKFYDHSKGLTSPGGIITKESETRKVKGRHITTAEKYLNDEDRNFNREKYNWDLACQERPCFLGRSKHRIF